MAEVEGQASMGQLRITLHDLDLTDSIAPSLEWVDPDYFNGVLTIGYTATMGARRTDSYQERAYLSDGEPVSISYPPGIPAPAGIEVGHAAPEPLGHQLWLSARHTPLDQAQTSVSGFISGQSQYFRLSPNTRLSLSMDVSVLASARQVASHQEYLQLYGSLSLYDSRAYEHVDGDWRMLTLGSGVELQEFDDTLTLTAQYDNAHDWGSTVRLETTLGVDAWAHPVSAVPEPSAYAMLLAGAALLAWRRRQATAAT